jgi:hypothetical protein
MTKMPKNIGVKIETQGRMVKIPSEAELERQFEPYAVEIGKLVAVWNRLHEKLARLFCLAAGIQNINVANAIWHSTDSDRTQRQMLRKAAEVTFDAEAHKKDGIIWLVNQIDTMLAGNRNDAIHAPLAFFTDADGTQLLPSWDSGHPRAKSLRGKDLMTEFKWYRDCAVVLANYAECMWQASFPSARFAWPAIPALPRKPPMTSPKKPTQPGK